MGRSSKGSSFERKVCKILSLWWSRKERDDIFWRSTTSGARATVRSRKGQTTFGQYGDIQAVDPVGQPLIDKCTIELKNGYKKWSVLDVLDKTERNAKQIFEKFIEQALEDSKKAGAETFLLITKRDSRVPVVFVPRKLYLEMSEFLGAFSAKYSEYCPVVLRCKIKDSFNDYLVGLRFSDFLNWCDPGFFQQ